MTDDTATIERDLAAVEAALASGAATHDEPFARELQELALQLRADAPRPAPAFADKLHRRVEAGFPREPRAVRRVRRQWLPSRRLMLSATGAAATLLVVGALVLAVSQPDGVTPASRSSDAGSSGGASEQSDSSGAPTAAESAGGGGAERAASGDTAAVAPAVPLRLDRNFAPGQRDRKIERTFSLELDVPVDDMARVADQVTTVTNRHGGFVLSSSVNSGREGGGGDFSLRIPSDRLRPALRDLAGLAPVIRQSQEGRDVTRRHVTATDRLQAARAERRSLLRRLEVADTDAEAEAIRQQLDLVSGEINGLRGQLRDLRLRTDYAVVNVSLLVAGSHDDNGGGLGGSFDDAVDDAGSLLVGFAGVLIRVLALGVPLGLIALAAWLGTRGLRRRRRESALA
ncbi:MAG: hypothetical protein QOE60_1400 [Thermoleophilaceae bacterium]|jgi:hypothetical protein|nr:hypothetical protein [Thermoleophilaceae bacterium]